MFNHDVSEVINGSLIVPSVLSDPSENKRLKAKANSNIANTEQAKQDHKTTYANIVSSNGIDISNKHKPNSQKSPRKTKKTSSDSDGFIGVERKRRKTRKFFLTGIAENVNENQILSYLNDRNIVPTYISIFPSRRRGTLSSRIHVPSAASSLVLDDNFWPKFVVCKPWRPKDNTKNPVDWEINLTQKGSFSTYV